MRDDTKQGDVRMKLVLKAAVAALCFASQAYAIDASFHPSTYTTYKKHGPYSGSVQVMENFPAVGKYIEIGLVRVPTDQVSGGSEAISELKEAAARHGGMAIVLEDDARIFNAGGTTERGTRPINATATAVILQ